MTLKTPLPESLLAGIPEDTRDALFVLIEFYQSRIAQLEARVAELEAQLKANSSNSHKPPSQAPQRRGC